MITALNKYIFKNPELMLSLSNFEDKILKKETDKITINKPVYITGLARSGTTITLEFLAAHSKIISHTYSDYPFIYTPYLSNKLSSPFSKNKKYQERAHHDGIMVNSDSPESMEEIIWAHFFRNAHNIQENSILNKDTQNQEFNDFYTKHIKKLLHIKKGSRYVAKANYNLTRISYLLSLFNDASIIIVIREPSAFIASSIKQDLLFSKEQKLHPKKLVHTDTSQHYEFGLHKKPINFNNTKLTNIIMDKLEHPETHIEAWALYWNTAYQYVLNLLNDKSISPHLKIVRFEDLCNNTDTELQKISNFCDINTPPETMDNFTNLIKKPSYYSPKFTNEELSLINKITGETAEKFGYNKE